MICYRLKTIFVHIPRTGGTSIEQILLRHDTVCGSRLAGRSIPEDEDKHKLGISNKHLPIAKLKNHVLVPKRMRKRNFQDFFKFTFVRNPWDRLVSVYKYAQTSVTVHPLFKGEFHEVVERLYETFNKSKLWKRKVNTPHGRIWQRVVNDLGYFTYRGNLLVDFIGRFEQLEEDIQLVCDTIGIPPGKIPHLNKIEREPYQAYYTPATVEMVAHMYKKSISYFDYSFD